MRRVIDQDPGVYPYTFCGLRVFHPYMLSNDWKCRLLNNPIGVVEVTHLLVVTMRGIIRWDVSWVYEITRLAYGINPP
jgi:hypothetical protein